VLPSELAAGVSPEASHRRHPRPRRVSPAA
jgi:hypothetical protein